MSSGFFNAKGSEANCSMSAFEPVLTSVVKGSDKVKDSVWGSIISFDSATKKLKLKGYAGTLDTLGEAKLMFQFKLGDGQTLSHSYHLLTLAITENLTDEEAPPEFDSSPTSVTVELDFANEDLQGTFESVEYTLPETSDPQDSKVTMDITNLGKFSFISQSGDILTIDPNSISKKFIDTSVEVNIELTNELGLTSEYTWVINIKQVEVEEPEEEEEEEEEEEDILEPEVEAFIPVFEGVNVEEVEEKQAQVILPEEEGEVLVPPSLRTMSMSAKGEFKIGFNDDI